MTATVTLAVVVGALLGAPTRYVVERRLLGAYPWGTWLVNVVGSAVLGALLGALAPRGGASSAAGLVALIGTGFCGSLTTFGGFAAQVLDLGASRDVAGRASASIRALGYGTVSILACVAVAGIGYVAARAVSG